MKYLYSLIFLFTLALPGFCADILFLKVPPSINIEKSRVKDLQLDTNIKNLVWFCPDTRLAVIQITEKRAIIQCLEDATVTIYFFYAEADVVKGPVNLKVIIGNGDNPNPGPNPGPTPGPQTDFEKAVASAYNSDLTTRDKLTARTTLINFYKVAITTSVADKGLDTVGKLVGVLALTAREAMGDNLDTTRKEIQKYLETKLPKATDTILTDSLRDTYKKEFEIVIKALEKI